KTNRGFVFIPEVGDQVMVGFEHNDPNRPFVMGSMFTGKNGAGGDEENVRKSIITRGGHTIELDDTKDKEKITIKDKDGSIITFDTKEKSLFVQSAETMEFSAKNINLNAEENIRLNAKNNVEVSTEADTILIAQGELKLQSDGATSVKSKDKLAMEATSDATLQGMNTIVEGKTSAEVNGAQTKVTGSAVTEVSGGIVKIN
ncbi:phage baseplate assembly protein V, partial [Tenacibaculum sp. SSH1-16]|uniref:phage baseplate assembly protein V n=1 Tax=Tenacibaculum sp. SSH1-16 TaxID=3136667 RepID=UPI0032C4612D